MQFPQNPHPHWAQNGRISTIRFHNLKYLEGNCMRNLSPADERRPQGLRAHIHTFTMRAFSGSSAKSPPTAARPAAVPQKTRPAHPLSPHVRYKTHPAHPRQQHLRYKTLPARPKWPNLARFAHAWRTFYRCRHQQATQGEFIHACGSNRPSRRIPLASSAAVEARHTATDLYTPHHGGAPHRQGRSTYSRRPLHPRSADSC